MEDLASNNRLTMRDPTAIDDDTRAMPCILGPGAAAGSSVRLHCTGHWPSWAIRNTPECVWQSDIRIRGGTGYTPMKEVAEQGPGGVSLALQGGYQWSRKKGNRPFVSNSSECRSVGYPASQCRKMGFSLADLNGSRVISNGAECKEAGFGPQKP